MLGFGMRKLKYQPSPAPLREDMTAKKKSESKPASAQTQMTPRTTPRDNASDDTLPHHCPQNCKRHLRQHPAAAGWCERIQIREPQSNNTDNTLPSPMHTSDNTSRDTLPKAPSKTNPKNMRALAPIILY